MSILRFLLYMVVSITLLISFTAALSGYRYTIQKADEIFDSNLSDFAQALMVISSPEVTSTSEAQSFAFQIWQNNTLIARNDIAPNSPMSDSLTGFSDENFSGKRWRTYSLTNDQLARRIIVSEPISVRVNLAEDLAMTSMAPLVFSTLLLAVLVALTIRQGLSPLKDLSHSLRQTEVDNLSPIRLNKIPKELSKVVATINRLMRKVQLAFERERRFASDASHELRTPISVLKINLHNILDKYPELEEDVTELQKGVDRMSHVVEQILLLNRTHPEHFNSKFVPVDLLELTQNAISECYHSIDDKQQNIELEAKSVIFDGDQFALMSLLNNLISNASKYTPDQGEIKLSIDIKDTIELVIENSGPGIPETEHERVLDRFYRVHGDQHPAGIIGCGLGMAIVKQVADLHHAEIRLAKSANLGGLKVIVRFAKGLSA